MKRLALLLVLAAWVTTGQPPPPGGQQGDGIWRRNAFFGEIQTLDACEGHQPGNGQYHYHANPICLRFEAGDNVELVRSKRTGGVYREKAAPWRHSPILGWALDGYPIYGPYGFADPRDGASAVKRLKSSFRLRSMTTRDRIPDWTLAAHPGISAQLNSTQFGPPINELFPLGRYIEDYEFVSGLGDLDQYNGRFTITPEYPRGTYAYVVSLDENGNAAFPYLISGQFYGSATGGQANSVPDTVQTYIDNGEVVGTATAAQPSLAAWMTKFSKQPAQVVSSFNPSAGPKTTWPSDNLWNTRVSGTVTSPVLAGIQRVRYSDTQLFVNASGLASHIMGPWFDPQMTGGDFMNYPSNQNYQVQLPRVPAEASSKPNTGMGPQGLWINGSAVFNFLDGASYSNARGVDGGGGPVNPTMQVISMISWEKGPVAPGSLLIGYSLFGAKFADRPETASSPWPTSLAGASMSVRDATGATFNCDLLYVSPTQIYFRLPEASAPGNAVLSIRQGSTTYTSNINIQSVYPNVAIANAEEVANATVIHIRGTQQVFESSISPFSLDGDTETYLVLYGSGRGKETTATATIGGIASDVAYAGPYPAVAGVDQYNLRISKSLAGKGAVDVILNVSGRTSNPVRITIR
jgi:uncharacterized protein (TIGR03437 family)